MYWGYSHKKRVLGNIRHPKASVWNGTMAQTFRKYHLAMPDNELMAECNSCYKKGRYADHEHELNDNFRKWLFNEKMFDKTVKILRKKRAQLLISDSKNYVKRILSKVKRSAGNFLRNILHA